MQQRIKTIFCAGRRCDGAAVSRRRAWMKKGRTSEQTHDAGFVCGAKEFAERQVVGGGEDESSKE